MPSFVHVFIVVVGDDVLGEIRIVPCFHFFNGSEIF